jgi:hypothetical protein
LRSAAAALLVAAAPAAPSSPSFGQPNTERPSSSPIARSSAKKASARPPLCAAMATASASDARRDASRK